MSERKNIDRLFQEKFKDFEAMPPEDAWANIEAKLDEKKKRRIVPFWWKLSGVAAVFLLGFFVSQFIYTNRGSQNGNPIVNGNEPGKIAPANSKGSNNENVNGVNGLPSENAVADESNSGKSNQKTTIKANEDNGSNAITSTSEGVKNNTANEQKSISKKVPFNTSASVVAEKVPTHKRSLKNKSNTAKGATLLTESIGEKQQDQVAQNTKGNNKSADNKQVAQADPKQENNKETQIPSDKAPINLDDLKGNVNSKIATKEIDKKVNDTATAGSVATNELEKLLNEKESKLKQESKRNRWQLTSNVAPVFLGSVSGGSPIDSTLSKNSKSYNTNVGYGIGVSYAVNRKFSIRTGLNKVNMSYDTHDITFFTGIQAKTLSGVQPVASSAMIHVESSVANTAATPSEEVLLPFENSFTHKSSGYLRQEMGYLEMPVEMTYNVLDKRFGLKIIGGFSTMFLQDNSIMIISENRDTLLGEANNLNDVHFSTNLGLGVKYSFLKSFEFNVEPTVKYQLNTYSSNAGNFKPYLFGIYSGISYKF